MFRYIKLFSVILMLQFNLYGLDAVNRFSKIDSRLLESIKENKLSEFKQLIKDANVLKRYEQDKTLLHYVVEYKRPQFVKYLIEKNIELDVKGGSYVSTPLHEAIRSGSLQSAYYILHKMTNVNVTDKYKQTPLHIAATMGLNDLILNLISKGAKTTLKDYRGYTPYDIAKDNINIDRAILDKMEPPKENIDSKKSFMEINKFSNKNRDEGSIYIRNSSFETENENRHNKRVPENSTVNVGY